MRHYVATLAEYPVCTQQTARVYWLGCRIHPSGRDVSVVGRRISPSQIITMADTCRPIVMLYLALQLKVTHIKKAINTGSYEYHIVQMCHDYDNVDLGKAMEWAAEGGYQEVVRLYGELRDSKFDLEMLWAANSGHKTIMRLFRDSESPILSNSWSGHGQQTVVVKMRCDYSVSGESLMSTRLWHWLRLVVTNPQFACVTIGVSKKSTWL